MKRIIKSEIDWVIVCCVMLGAYLVLCHALLALEEWPPEAKAEIVGKHYTWRAK
jgi:hypothetical protein